MKMNSKLYDILKYIQRIAIPAIAALYAALAAQWLWPYAEQIVGTLSAVDVCMGALLEVSSAQYRKSEADG